MKSQQETISYIIMVAILIVIVTTAYIWASPMIQKNRDITILNNAYEFMKSLNEKIKSVANNGGRESVYIDFGNLFFENGAIIFSLETLSTIYEPGKRIYFVKNPECQIYDNCILGEDEPELFYVESRKIEEKYYTTYYLTYRKLNSVAKSYKISLEGEKQIGKGKILIEHKGNRKEGNTVISIIEIKIV
mgnify:CR=1 FL=1